MANDPVLLVDPDPAFLRSVQRVFDAAGLDLDTASTGEEALIMLTTTPYAVVVAATNLTDMTPKRFLARVTQLRPDCEAVALMASRDLELAVDLYEHGNLFNHLWKPVEEIGDLTRQVGRAFERRALKRHNAYLLTELRDAREDLHQQAEFLAQAEKLAVLGHSVRNVASEVAEPLQKLAGSAAYLGMAIARVSPEGWTPAQATDFAHVAREMQKAACSCLDWVRDVAACYDETCDAPTETDVHDVLRETIAFLHSSAEARGIEMRLALADDLPMVRANRPEVRQALTHVILNAIQAMPKGGVLDLSTETEYGQRDRVRLTVRDSGTGIPADCLPHIFEPFYTTRPTGEGSGLGLHIARSVIRRHGGDIHVETKQGFGTAVRVTLPTALQAAARPGGAPREACVAA